MSMAWWRGTGSWPGWKGVAVLVEPVLAGGVPCSCLSPHRIVLDSPKSEAAAAIAPLPSRPTTGRQQVGSVLGKGPSLQDSYESRRGAGDRWIDADSSAKRIRWHEPTKIRFAPPAILVRLVGGLAPPLLHLIASLRSVVLLPPTPQGCMIAASYGRGGAAYAARGGCIWRGRCCSAGCAMMPVWGCFWWGPLLTAMALILGRLALPPAFCAGDCV